MASRWLHIPGFSRQDPLIPGLRRLIDGCSPGMDAPHGPPVPTDDVGRLGHPEKPSQAAAAASYMASGASVPSDTEARLDLPPSLPPKYESPAPSTLTHANAIPKPEQKFVTILVRPVQTSAQPKTGYV